MSNKRRKAVKASLMILKRVCEKHNLQFRPLEAANALQLAGTEGEVTLAIRVAGLLLSRLYKLELPVEEFAASQREIARVVQSLQCGTIPK